MKIFIFIYFIFLSFLINPLLGFYDSSSSWAVYVLPVLFLFGYFFALKNKKFGFILLKISFWIYFWGTMAFSFSDGDGYVEISIDSQEVQFWVSVITSLILYFWIDFFIKKLKKPLAN